MILWFLSLDQWSLNCTLTNRGSILSHILYLHLLHDIGCLSKAPPEVFSSSSSSSSSSSVVHDHWFIIKSSLNLALTRHLSSRSFSLLTQLPLPCRLTHQTRHHYFCIQWSCTLLSVLLMNLIPTLFNALTSYRCLGSLLLFSFPVLVHPRHQYISQSFSRLAAVSLIFYSTALWSRG